VERRREGIEGIPALSKNQTPDREGCPATTEGLMSDLCHEHDFNWRNALIGGWTFFEYQLAFGLSLRYYQGKPMFRIYVGPLKVWGLWKRPR